MIYDYSGFPPHTYQLNYPVAGDPALAARAAELLSSKGLEVSVDEARGIDHGLFQVQETGRPAWTSGPSAASMSALNSGSVTTPSMP